MARTGARARTLSAILEAGGWTPVPTPPRPRLGDLSSEVMRAVRQVFEDLQGILAELKNARPGGYDLAFDTGSGTLIVELDEEQHSNRYRAQTLSQPWASDLPWTADYLVHCQREETPLLRTWVSGRRWTNESAPRFFGPASPPGDFTGVGSPRWRQRAFYDAVKDLIPAIRLARLSVHDHLGDRSVEAILRSADLTTAPEVQRLLSARAHTWAGPPTTD